MTPRTSHTPEPRITAGQWINQAHQPLTRWHWFVLAACVVAVVFYAAGWI